MFIREDGNRSYVYKKGKHGRLEKQYVEVGKNMYGSIEIISGLTMEDAMISSNNVERACEMYLAILGAGRQVRKLPEDYMEMAKKKSLARRNVVL